MNYKILSFAILSIFLLSGISAVSVDSYFINNNFNKYITISNGDATSFDVDFSSAYPPVTIKVNVYNSQNNPIYSFTDKTINQNGKSSVYSIDQSIYQNPGTYTIQIIGKDSSGSIDSEFLTLIVNPSTTNHAPQAENQDVTTNQNIPVIIILSATDEDHDALMYSIVNEPLHGSLSNIFDLNQVTYTPNLGFSGPDFFRFKVNDGSIDSNTATISITVNPIIPTTPEITIISPEENKEYHTDDINLRVETDMPANVGFRLDEGAITEMNNPSDNLFTYTLHDLSNGEHFVTFYIIDSDDNAISPGQTVSFSVEIEEEEHKKTTSRAIVDDFYYQNKYLDQFETGKTIYTEKPVSNNTGILILLYVILAIVSLGIILVIYLLFRNLRR